MQMRVLMFFSYGKQRAGQHQDSTNSKRDTQVFAQQEIGDKSTGKGCCSVVHAGSGSAKPSLGPDIEKDTHAIGNESNACCAQHGQNR